jgi:hypothetical protein
LSLGAIRITAAKGVGNTSKKPKKKKVKKKKSQKKKKNTDWGKIGSRFAPENNFPEVLIRIALPHHCSTCPSFFIND